MKQTLVALSTEEAEYTAFTEGNRDPLWIRQLLQEILNRDKPDGELGDSDLRLPTLKRTIVFGDNQAAIKHATSEGISARTRHFDIRLQHSRDLVKKGIVDLVYIKSENNIADSLTKELPRVAHERHVKEWVYNTSFLAFVFLMLTGGCVISVFSLILVCL